MQTETSPFLRHLSILELTRYIVLNKLLGLVFTVIGSSLEIDAVAEMFLYKHYRPLFLSLIPEGCQSSGVDECGFLLEVVS